MYFSSIGPFGGFIIIISDNGRTGQTHINSSEDHKVSKDTKCVRVKYSKMRISG